MPFGPYENFDDCVNKVSHKKDAPSNPKAYCGWLQSKIEGEDPVFFEIFEKYKEWDVDLRATIFSYYRFETILVPSLSEDLMNREKAEAALKGANVWKKDDDATVLDDHRWAHMWANTIKSGNNLFISRKELRKLHDKIVDELARRKIRSGIEHKSPMNVAPYELGGELESFLKSREPFLIDAEFINVVGSSVTGVDPQDLNLVFKTSKKEYAESMKVPAELSKLVDIILEDNGPQGPYIPAYELWAVPVKSPKPKEPKYNIHPMAPIPPATPSKALSDPNELLQDSYYVYSPQGARVMVHRKENDVIAFNEKLEELELPETVLAELLNVEKPKTFILDGFLSAGVYYMIDMPWWGESEHIQQTAEQRRRFLERMPQSRALQRAPSLFFSNRKDAIAFLKEERGPYYVVPGTTTYPADGKSDWNFYSREDKLSLSEPLWDRMKNSFQIDVLVVGLGAVGDDYFVYAGAVGPVEAPKEAGLEKVPINMKNYGAFVEYEGKTYTILGNTDQTEFKAEIGDVIRVSVAEIQKMDEFAYSWFKPKSVKAGETIDSANRAEDIRQMTLKKKRELSWNIINGQFKVTGGCPSEAYLVNARYGHNSPLACCYAPWIAVPDIENLSWNYFKNDDQVYDKLRALGVEEIIGTKTERELLQKMDANNITFRIASGVELISDLRAQSMKLEEPTQVELDIPELKKFYDTIRPPFKAEAMKLHCGGTVPLKIKNLSETPYMSYPTETQRYTLQFHVNGLDVHADLRATVNQKQALNWTLNLGKSLLEPMVRRYPSLQGKKLSKKTLKALAKKADELKPVELRELLTELWGSVNLEEHILTQRRTPTAAAWLDFENGIPTGAVGDQTELQGRLVIMDRGSIEYGAQKSHFHEYFLNGEKLGRRKLTMRRAPTNKSWNTEEKYAWISFFSDYNSPHVLASDWIPPEGVSALPKDIEAQIPGNMRYWKAKNVQAIRDRVVSSLEENKLVLKMAPLQFTLLQGKNNSLLIHAGNTIYDNFNFGSKSPLEGGGLVGHRQSGTALPEITVDVGVVKLLEDTNNRIKLHLEGAKLRGSHVLVKESPTSNTWIFQKTELSDASKAILMANPDARIIRCGSDDVEIEQGDGLLIIRGPAIKPGEVIPMDGKPTYFTKEGIKRFWPSMARQPVVVLHGDLKGDVVGFVNKNWYDEKTGWGWAEAVIWHPLAMELILGGKLASFSIEILPETIWDAEHQHDHVIGGNCIGLSVVPKGACPTCNPVDARMGTVQDIDGKVYKFGMTMKEYLIEQYYKLNKSTTEIAETEGIPRSTLESWMNRFGLNRRTMKEARYLRKVKELGGGRVSIVALGTGSMIPLEGDDPQVSEASEGGKSKRNPSATLISIGNEHLLINAPKGILGMLATKYAKPRYVVFEDLNEAISDLHQLRSLKPIVLATADQWAYLRANYADITGEKGKFEDIYSFDRKVLPEAKVQAGSYLVEGVPLENSLGFKVDVGGKILLHASNVEKLKAATLDGVDLYIGDGSDLKRISTQLAAVVKANTPKAFFTKIGPVGLTHEDLDIELQKISPNSEALFDGAEISLGGDTPVAYHSEAIVEGLLNGSVEAVLRDKPYAEYSKQTIMFGTDKAVTGLYVEGYPEEMSHENAAVLKHGLTPSELNQFGESVWVYTPRVLKRFDTPREMEKIDVSGPYIHDASLSAPMITE